MINVHECGVILMKGTAIVLLVLVWLLGVIVFIWMLPMLSIILLGVGLAFFLPAMAKGRKRV